MTDSLRPGCVLRSTAPTHCHWRVQSLGPSDQKQLSATQIVGIGDPKRICTTTENSLLINRFRVQVLAGAPTYSNSADSCFPTVARNEQRPEDSMVCKSIGQRKNRRDSPGRHGPDHHGIKKVIVDVTHCLGAKK